MMTLVDSSGAYSAGGDNLICLGYGRQFDLASERSGEVTRLFTLAEGIKPHLVGALDLYEDEEPELLLCYNSKLEHIMTMA